MDSRSWPDDGPQSGYFLSLVAALAEHFPEDFEDMLEEFDFHEEPRNWEEIRDAEQEMFDRVWYNRSLYFEEHAEAEGGDADEHERIAGPARARVEAKYGAENLGPYTDFEWGMINGKLSALRWVTGSGWGLPRYVARAQKRACRTGRGRQQLLFVPSERQRGTRSRARFGPRSAKA